jgi:carbonic anhydrase/acetyltransferase-like protein (isoleucine patch superfamily)
LIGFNSVVFNATLGVGVIVMHQALVEGVTIPSGLHVPSMMAVRNKQDVRRLARATREMISFAEKIFRTNVLLATAASDRKTSK